MMMCHPQQPHPHLHADDDHRQRLHHDVCGVSEEEDPPDHPHPHRHDDCQTHRHRLRRHVDVWGVRRRGSS